MEFASQETKKFAADLNEIIRKGFEKFQQDLTNDLKKIISDAVTPLKRELNLIRKEMEDEDTHKDSEVEENEVVKTTEQTTTNDFQQSGEEEIEAGSEKGASCGGLDDRLGGQTGGCRNIIAHNHNGGEVFGKEGGRRESGGRPGDFAGGFTGGGNGDYVGGLNVCAGGLIFVWVKRRRGGRDDKDGSVGCGSGGGPGGGPGGSLRNGSYSGGVLGGRGKFVQDNSIASVLSGGSVDRSGRAGDFDGGNPRWKLLGSLHQNFRERGEEVYRRSSLESVIALEEKTILEDLPSKGNLVKELKDDIIIEGKGCGNHPLQESNMSRGNKEKPKRDSINMSEVSPTFNLPTLIESPGHSSCDLNETGPIFGLCDFLQPQLLKPDYTTQSTAPSSLIHSLPNQPNSVSNYPAQPLKHILPYSPTPHFDGLLERNKPGPKFDHPFSNPPFLCPNCSTHLSSQQTQLVNQEIQSGFPHTRLNYPAQLTKPKNPTIQPLTSWFVQSAKSSTTPIKATEFFCHPNSNSTHFSHNQTSSLDKLLSFSAMGKLSMQLKSTLGRKEMKQHCKQFSSEGSNHYFRGRTCSANYYPP
ncbi:uncharacterized protein LOC130591535 [Beta vulgaris subsp. vulgaris]|uniref:uncharacterized protein LOC130591535 n=1 Tax=Beta vulgaris subsp. vulgaris TaxID=3555 RepID=UPI0025467DDD|nr:uncharacterized protein LOC130591535 [Beta vulgaris subsp. vulgaris]